MECVLKILHLLAEIAAPCVKAFREGSEKARNLEARVEIAERKWSELEQKDRVSQSEIRSLREELATERAGKHLAAAVLVFLMFFYRVSPLLVGLTLGVLYSSLLLRLSGNLEEYVSQGLRLSARAWQSASREMSLVLGHLMDLVERIRRRTREWKLKSVPASQSYKTAP
jgi:hypothetical protein